ncbi:AI-2E family transporter [Crenobacter sp. SG2305]|uniref:AI-2E family transporter n=1 Tax=Crenobacter oryzisoli TaxID=3056844 RepID=UPI0025AAD14D|nr:AI-2E family transporter [Crenobacter sp. SG2305]MDN0084182.1 AI-2E family transporter [Crenobacter sp. SG2305]
MTRKYEPDEELERHIASRLLDVLIRAGLVLALVMLCYRVFSPFLTLMVWAVILAVTLYPLQQKMARKMGGKQGWAATLLVLLSLLLLFGPTVLLLSSLGDSVQETVTAVQTLSVKIPVPNPSIAAWPIIGKKIYAAWVLAYNDLPAFVKSMQPKVVDLTKVLLGVVAGIGGGLLQLLASFIIAGIIMAFGQAGAKSSLAIFRRIVGAERGDEFAKLSTSTIRAVAQGVIGIAFIQAIIVGLCLIIASVPWPGVLTVIVLVLGIAQVPALIVTLPAIIYIWSSHGDYSNVEAIGYTVLLLVAGMADNVLKPLMLGRGVEAPMPVVLLGALGGMATAGILGMFIGAVLLVLGYSIFMGWVAANPHSEAASAEDHAET